MPRRFWLIALSAWPGLAQIWTGQEVMGLIVAALFAVALNLAVLGSAVWTELLPPGALTFLTALAAMTWLTTLAYTVWWLWLCHPHRHRAEIDRLFREALELYLRGRWVEARDRCEAILTRNENDVEALLQLGLIHVRTGQSELARHTLRQCLEIDGGSRWKWEIQQTLRRIEPSRGN
jgi:hypothetical protein